MKTSGISLRGCVTVVLMCLCSISIRGQVIPDSILNSLPPDIREMLLQLDPELSKTANGHKGAGFMQPLINVPAYQEPAWPLPPSENKGKPGKSAAGQTSGLQDTFLIRINSQLDTMAYLLPDPAMAPSQNEMLKIASARYAEARMQFAAGDMQEFTRLIHWIPIFDGKMTDPEKARNYSMLVATTTNYLNRPHLVVAMAAAVFALDPGHHVTASNFASAVIAAGEHMHPPLFGPKALEPYRKDAETGFLYAMAKSMTDNSWTEKSLTAILNLGNLYIDMNRLEEARSLFQVARKINPYSWDAALGMAAYFHAKGQFDKAKAVLEDDNLDRPAIYAAVKKSKKALEKSEEYTELTPETPDEVFEDGIELMASEPIATAADFFAQIDQEERNKMRYFVENLPVAGSFKAPPIKSLIQFSTLKKISEPVGVSALHDFEEMLQLYTLSSSASVATQQLENLSRLGIDINLGVDINDVAKNPWKYADQKNNTKVTTPDPEAIKAKFEGMRKEAERVERDLTTGKTSSLLDMMSLVDPYIAVLQIDPRQYADPMNVLIQKHNYTVYHRKNNLYAGYLHALNKRTASAVREIVTQTHRKFEDIRMNEEEVMAAFFARKDNAKQAAYKQGRIFPEAEWNLQEHALHVRFFNEYNNVAEVGFGSATNLVSTTYLQKIKPMAEAWYYDVIRHIALISDSVVRGQKDAELHSSIHQSLVWALNTVLFAHGSFSYHNEWDCDCDYQHLQAMKEAEDEALHAEAQARILKGMAAKKQFDSGEIPESSPLFKKLDAYGTDFNYIFISGRISCARTVVKLNVSLPIPGSPEITLSKSTSENTGAATYGGGLKVGIEADLKAGKVGANFSISGSVSTDGQGVVKDYAITAAAGVAVTASGTTVQVGGSLTFGPNGVVDSDFSAGISKSYQKELGGVAKASFEVSTKRGCTLSGNIEQSIEPYKSAVDDIAKETYGDNLAKAIPTDFLKKKLWDGKIGGT